MLEHFKKKYKNKEINTSLGVRRKEEAHVFHLPVVPETVLSIKSIMHQRPVPGCTSF